MRQSSTRALKYQKAVAVRLREGDVGFLNESAEMRVYERRLLQKGLTDSEVEDALEGVFVRESVAANVDAAAVGRTVAMNSGSSTSGVLAPTQSPLTGSMVANTQKEDALASGRRQSKIPEGEVGYVLSLVRRGKQTHKKLHYLGQCHLVPGVDYLRYDWMGPQRPDVELYDSVCTRCWPAENATEDEISSSGSGEVDSP